MCFLAADETSRVEMFLLSDEGFAAFRKKLRRTDRAAVETSGNVHFFHEVVAK